MINPVQVADLLNYWDESKDGKLTEVPAKVFLDKVLPRVMNAYTNYINEELEQGDPPGTFQC